METIQNLFVNRTNSQSSTPTPHSRIRAHRKRRCLSSFAASSLLLPVSIHAQTTPTPDPQAFVITATRSATATNDVLAQVSVITRADIVDAGAATLTDLLQRRANLDIRATGGPGQPSSVFIRGTNATHTLVLIDGQRIASSTSGAAALENIALDLIDRIEIVRGPLSSLYGSDAIGGVIQVFTRGVADATDATSVDASLGGGSYSASQINGKLSTSLGEAKIALSASQRRVDAPVKFRHTGVTKSEMYSGSVPAMTECMMTQS